MIRLALLFVFALSSAQAQSIGVSEGDAVARFEAPTSRYGHAIMGKLPEWSRLCLGHGAQTACVDLPETSVFEDIAPRLADMNGDGQLDAVVVESSFEAGASLVVYLREGDQLRRVSTPPIGLRNRWLAPIGIADFDRDGRMDVAYVEKPHLDKTIKVYSWDADHLKLIAKATRFSNHRIGDEFIASGVRDCGQGPEMIVPDGRWQRVYKGWFSDGTLRFEELGPMRGASVETYLAC